MNRKPAIAGFSFPFFFFFAVRGGLERKKLTIEIAEDAREDTLEAVDAEGEADEVGGHHHEDVDEVAEAGEEAVGAGMAILPAGAGGGGREGVEDEHLGEHEEDDEPAPDEQAELDVVPDGDEGEDEDVGGHGAGGGARRPEARAPQRYVDVPQRPAVEAPVPAAPERQRAYVVGDAADHVLGGVEAVVEGPQPRQPPG